MQIETGSVVLWTPEDSGYHPVVALVCKVDGNFVEIDIDGSYAKVPSASIDFIGINEKTRDLAKRKNEDK